MQKVNLYDAKTHLSRIISKVQETGETYVIARNGKPMAKIVPLSAAEKTPRIGFMKGKISAPDNFNELNSDDISDQFYGK
ncbi:MULTISPECIES: type II toxin-antitoxin system Phd/YefM family antitoxin [Sodalis]|jgi:prevent-host-death family protein|uniref:Antitoxin n=1 Tax=Sodalis ligni TaxID=2697027 RepID=A0A4V2Q3B6_9GAMM|nr:type II toxin-antitoxin system prevent-host-death family antitoxin [Sodalis ligni]TCL06188.1 prevent-host-death family protein [Sodalis ligni]